MFSVCDKIAEHQVGKPLYGPMVGDGYAVEWHAYKTNGQQISAVRSHTQNFRSSSFDVYISLSFLSTFLISRLDKLCIFCALELHHVDKRTHSNFRN